MNYIKNQKSSFLISMSSLLLMLVMINISCSQKSNKTSSQSDQSDTSIKIAYPNWAEGIAFTHLAQAALLDKGYNVKITPLDPGPIYAALAKGGYDIMMDAWLPNTHKDYWAKYGDKLEKIGESFSDGTTGLVVPTYVEINSIEELNANADKFDGKIMGIGSGAGIHANTEKAIEEYSLDFKQITSSGPAMLASLKRAYAKKEPIVITGWKPHYMWGDYELKYLDDPKGVYPKDVCAIITRKDFKKNNPVVGEFLTNFNMKESDLLDLLAKIKESDDTEIAAKKWYNNHKELVESWMPEKMKAHK